MGLCKIFSSLLSRLEIDQIVNVIDQIVNVIDQLVNWKLKSLGKAKSWIFGYPEVAQKIQNNFPDTIWHENWLLNSIND